MQSWLFVSLDFNVSNSLVFRLATSTFVLSPAMARHEDTIAKLRRQRIDNIIALRLRKFALSFLQCRLCLCCSPRFAECSQMLLVRVRFMTVNLIFGMNNLWGRGVVATHVSSKLKS